jgi:hypothetical protein
MYVWQSSMGDDVRVVEYHFDSMVIDDRENIGRRKNGGVSF